MKSKTKIIIVDDHLLFREGIKLLIETEGLGIVIAEADNGKIFIEMLKKHKPDLVLMDIEMPEMGGIEATIKAKEIYPDLKISALTMLNNKESYTEMIKAGAMGFVLKTSGKQILEKAIKTLIEGDSYFSNEQLRQAILNSNEENQINEIAVFNNIEFTKKEIEILHYMCKGFSTEEIAKKLSRSVKTIESHRSNLLGKTNTKNAVNLVLFAIKNKLVSI